MLLESDNFDPSGSLPDVSRAVVLPVGVGSASALAGIHSGQDYAKSLLAAAYRPLFQDKKEVDLDAPPGASALAVHERERRNLSRQLREAIGGRGRPEPTPPSGGYSAPSYNNSAPLPGTDAPVATTGGEGNLLAPPPGDPNLFPTTPTPLVPPPLTVPKDEWDPSKLFMGY